MYTLGGAGMTTSSSMSRLNVDVLFSVCGFLTAVPDVLAFSLTCSTLRPAAVHRRLSMRPVTITDQGSINNLYDFVFVDKTARGPHIHTIAIPEKAAQLLIGLPEELLHRLLAILSAATHVRTLSLYLPFQSTRSLLAHPLIVPAIARLTGIRNLSLVASFERANALLRCIRSPIKTLRYESPDKDGSALCDRPFTVPRRLSAVHSYRAMRQEMDEELALEDVARHLGSTLCELELPHSYLPWRGFDSSQHKSAPPKFKFLAVRSFALRDVAELVRLDILLHMLPNLDDTLVVEASRSFYQRVRDRERVEVTREDNLLAQERHGWKRLERVVSSPLLFFTLGLTCPIRHLDLDLSPDERLSSSDVLDTLAHLPRHARCTILRDPTPTHLTIRGLRFPAGLAHLDDLFSADGALARTTHLVVVAEYNSVVDGKLVWPEDVLEALLARIEHFGLTHVRIVASGLVSDADPFASSVHHGIRDLSLDRLAVQFQDAVPSLSHVFLTARGVVLKDGKEVQEVWDVSKAWRVLSAAASVSVCGDLQELSVDDAEAALDREDMQIMGGPKEATY